MPLGAEPSVSIIVEVIAADPGMAGRLLNQHADDGTGHCRVCSGGGQSGRFLFPCSLRNAAETAARLMRSRKP